MLAPGPLKIHREKVKKRHYMETQYSPVYREVPVFSVHLELMVLKKQSLCVFCVFTLEFLPHVNLPELSFA